MRSLFFLDSRVEIAESQVNRLILPGCMLLLVEALNRTRA